MNTATAYEHRLHTIPTDAKHRLPLQGSPSALKPKSLQNMNNTTEHSTKADIITAALEITDTQAVAIDRLEQRQLILWSLVGVLAVTLALKG